MPNVKLHHVVYCVQPQNQERAAAYWRDLGCTFGEVPLAEEGIRVLLDWASGVEIIAPTEPEGTETARFRAFLDEADLTPVMGMRVTLMATNLPD